jgi:hypothetical protein
VAMNKVWLGIGVAVAGALTLGVTAGQSVRELFSANPAVAAVAATGASKVVGVATSAPVVVDTHAIPQTAAARAIWSDEGRTDLQAYFDGAFGDPKAVVAMTRALLVEAAKDDRWRQPEQASAAALRIRQVLLGLHTRAYYAPAAVEADLSLGKGDFGWALGAQNESARGKLTALTKGSPAVRGRNLAEFVVPNADGVLEHGLTNLDRFAERLPNGDYRVILLSHATRDGRSTAWPFGSDVRVNGARRQFVETDITEAGGWIEAGAGGVVSHHPVEVAAAAGQKVGNASSLAGIAPGRTGVALVVPAQVRSGRLVLSMVAANAEPVAVSAIIAQRTDYTGMHFTTGRLLTGALAGVVGSADAAEGVIANAEAFAAPSAKPTGLAISIGAKEAQLADAVAGAVDGSDVGLAALQAYFDDSAGDPARLMGRVKAVARAAQVDLTADSEVRNRIRAAAVASQSASFITRGQIRRDYRVGRGGYAWDFIGADKAVYGDFRRITPQSAELTGQGLTLVDIAPWRSNLTTEGIQGVDTFKVKVPNGRYRAYIYTPKIYQPGGSPDSFGGPLVINEEVVSRRVDLRNRSPELWLRHGSPQLAYLGGYEAAADARQRFASAKLDTIEMAPQQVLPARGHCGLVMSVPAKVTDGELALDFSPDSGKKPTVAGVVLVPQRGGIDPLFEPASGGRQGPRGVAGDDPAPDVDPSAGAPTADPAAGFGGNPTVFAAPGGSTQLSNPRGGRNGFRGGSSPVLFGGGGGGGVAPSSTDNGTTTGGSTTGGTTTGGTTTGGTTTGGTTTGGDGTSTGGTTTGGTTTGGTTTGGTTTGGSTTGGSTTGGTTTGGSTTGGNTTGGSTTGGTTTGGNTTGGSTTGGSTTGGSTTGGTTTGGNTTGGSTTGGDGTSTGGSTTGGTTTGGTSTGGTTTGGTTTGGTSTGGTTTGGTTTGGTSTGGTSTGGTTTGGTTTGGSTTGGSTTGGTTTGGTTTGGTSTGGTTTGGTSTGGTTTGGSTTGGTTTGGTTTGGTTTGGTDIVIRPDAGPDYEVCLNDEVNLLGAANLAGGINLSDVTVEWLLATTGGSGTIYTSLNINTLNGTLQTGAGTPFTVPGLYELVLKLTYDGKEYLDSAILKVCPACGTDVPEPPAAPLMVLGAGLLLWWRRRRG